MTQSEHQPTARTIAFDAVVQLAIDRAGNETGRWYGPDIETPEVVEHATEEVSNRTALRACQDAAALGWVDDKLKGWDVGERAEEIAGVSDQ
jgi:hypothetical protein